MRVRAVIASPLFHFFVLGGLMFALYNVMNPQSMEHLTENRIVLSKTGAERLIEQFTATWKRPPTAAELEGLMQDWTLEEVLVREAQTLSLDQGDAMIRNRLRQKMLFLAEAPAAAMTPDEATLEAFYQANAQQFLRSGELSFDQVQLPPGWAEQDVVTLKQQLESGQPPSTLGRASLLPPSIEHMDERAVARMFGPAFGQALASLPEQRWSGPLQSGYGWHLVQVNSRVPSALPPLGEVRERVLTYWRAEEAAKLRNAYTQALLQRASVDLPDPAELLQP